MYQCIHSFIHSLAHVDEIDVEGFETGVGTNFINKGNPATEDAHIVALLRAHGAVIVGKSTMHEIGKQLSFTTHLIRYGTQGRYLTRSIRAHRSGSHQLQS